MSKYISINRHIIASNAKNCENKPVIRVAKTKTAKPEYYSAIEIRGPSKVMYNPHEPILKCGARLVIVTDAEVAGYVHND